MRPEKENVVIFAMLVLLFIGIVLGTLNGRKQIRTEAALLGHAEYVPDEHGNPTFRWREGANETP